MFVQSQTVYVSLAHRYWNFQWSEARNREIYGTQASVEGVGSNLRLEVAVRTDREGDVDLSVATAFLKKLIDHRCCFVDIPAFAEAPSTLETITQYLAAELFRTPPPAGRWAYLLVAENEHLSCKITPQAADVVEMRVRVLNLELALQRAVDGLSGLAMDRREAEASVRAIAPDFSEPSATGETAWAESLSRALGLKVKGLSELRIDLGSQRILRVRS